MKNLVRGAKIVLVLMLATGPAFGNEVDNPEVPLNGIQIQELEELWRIGGPEDEENLLGVIDQVLVDDEGHLYLLDAQLVEVLVYSADGEYLQSLGRRGEGPGEIQRLNQALFLPDGTLGMIQTFPGKIVKVDLDGLPAGSWAPDQDDPSRGGFFVLRHAAVLGDRMVMSGARVSRGETSRTATDFIADFTLDGVESTRYLELVTTREFRPQEIKEDDSFFPHQGRWDLGPDGRLFVAPDRNGYRIEIFGPDGGLQMVVTRPFESWQRSDQEMERARERMMPFRRRNRNQMNFVMEPTERDIIRLRVDAANNLWILTSRGIRDQEPGIHSTWDVFDAEGTFDRQVAMRCEGSGLEDALYFAGEDLVVLVREHASARQAFFGQGGQQEENVDPEIDARPLEVICYRMIH